ncbi:prepilin peptidase [Aquicella lusitana]|uniref:Prepilin leader peptidase/N-methyltransferase n=1 Tax=Aquicella lusitana TaxID=254246 RepID=A0A370GDB6_9COXI|nr:A24 family peptidase [Aquicella lusitana]RDI41788.1 type 4 prepilin peptidase 1 [Aquicella lusitana]VVC73697.1 Type 4 prepilin-like proteins leader peptide-processing enzyme [Aquicella lusitana]
MDIVLFFAANPDIFLIVTAILSLFIGSFLNVVIYRLPRMMEQSWSEECRVYLGLKPHAETEKLNLYLPFSHCPQCKKVIRPWHNIPILSYLWLRGQCAYCTAPISIRYPLVEALTCIVSAYVAWKFGFSWQTAAALLFTWIIICLTFIDLDYHLLPDQLTLLLLWLGLFFSIFNLFCTSHDAIIGAIVGYIIFAATQLLFEWTTGKTGMGQGDFKFLAALGAYLGWQMLPLIILLASITGILFAVAHMIVKRHIKSVPLPFGPYLAFAGWIAMLWGNEIMLYYFEMVY